MTEQEIQKKLFELQDLSYRDFQAKLMPTIDKSKIIGVRTPQLKAFAKELSSLPETEKYLSVLPHDYYDEYNLHGFIISRLKDYEKAVKCVNEILPYVDNWATCDLLSPKVFAKHKAELLQEIDKWLKSNEVYTIRFGIEMLMSHFLDEDFKPEFLEKVAVIKSDEYYVNMMIAWFFATALAKQWKDAVLYVEGKTLSPWVQNKTIQKAVESYRISDEQKAFLKTLKM